MQCQKCKKEVLEDSVFCNYCGAKQEPQDKECINPQCGRKDLPLEAVFCPDCGTKIAESQSSYTEVVNGVSFDMIFVEGGSFMMGSNEGSEDEKPIHKVMLDNYRIGTTPVTQALWEAVMGKNLLSNIIFDCPPPLISPIFGGMWFGGEKIKYSDFKGTQLPLVMGINMWDKVDEFLKRLNTMTNKRYRLPTEAEWEYAARGGKESCGYKYSGSNNLDEVAWYRGNSENKMHPVGTKQPNELGLYDMSGNVWEWCSDWYDEVYYKQCHEKNPKGPVSGSKHVLRGGSWYDSVNICRVSVRLNPNPAVLEYGVGFRLVQN